MFTIYDAKISWSEVKMTLSMYQHTCVSLVSLAFLNMKAGKPLPI